MGENKDKKREINIKSFKNIYYFEFGKNFSHSPEEHSNWEMVYVDNGRINALANENNFVLEQGQIIFHEPYEIHAHISDNRVANNMLVVSFDTDSDAMNILKGKPFTLDKTSKTILSFFLHEVKNALGYIPSDYEKKEGLKFTTDIFGSEQLLKCYFTEFLITLIRTREPEKKDAIPNKRFSYVADNTMSELVTEYMKKNIYSSLTLKDFCEHFLIGKTQLCKIFNESVGRSPMEYYSSLKIVEAKRLLREKDYSVTQISDMLGYSSIHTFSRAFKQAVGFSPTAYVNSIL